ncbi:hypothetical protein [Clostridium sp. BJN0013]|uniref:hypothetical protein n=1 Tax=Clostridium sp. BJN0013 TaxID=3236840 RepID=UPI0034C61229
MGVLLSAEEYKCNLAVCRAEETTDTWHIVTNMDSKKAVREYKKRFIIEEKNKAARIYSLFRSGLIWFNRCYDSE